MVPAWPTETPSFTCNKEICRFVYDDVSRYLQIVSIDAGKVVDVIDVDDVVGSDIQIQLHDDSPAAAVEPRSEKLENEPPTSTLTDRQGSALLSIFAYPRKTTSSWSSRLLGSRLPQPNPHYERPEKACGPRVAFHRYLSLEPAEDLSQAQELVKAIRSVSTRGPTRQDNPPRYWVIVNPVSGPKRNAAQLADTVVLPMLEQAGIETTVLHTTHRHHALEAMTEDDAILSYSGLVLIGGDGLVHEVLNGIRSRVDGDQLLQQKLTIGIVGGGTSNGLATSITHAAGESYGALQDAFLIAKGSTITTDLSSYQIAGQSKQDGGATTPKLHSYTSFLTFSWAFIAEVDIDSECLRFLGETRYDVWGVWLVLRSRSYKAKLCYTKNEEPAVDINDPVPSHWTELEADFVLLWASHTTHAGKTNYHSPKSDFSDEQFQLFVIRRPISRFQLARVLLSLDTGSHADLQGVEWIQCKQYRLTPDTAQAATSYNNVDGELVEAGPVHATVLKKHVRYFGRVGS